MSKEKDSYFRDWLWEVNGVETDPEVEQFIQEIKENKGVYEYEDGIYHGTLFFLCVISANPNNSNQEFFLVKRGGNSNQFDIVLVRDLLNWTNNKGKVPEFQELRNDTPTGEWTNGSFPGAMEGEGITVPQSTESIKLNFAAANS